MYVLCKFYRNAIVLQTLLIVLYNLTGTCVYCVYKLYNNILSFYTHFPLLHTMLNVFLCIFLNEFYKYSIV